MDVAVTELRAHLGRWLDRARQGDEVVITDHGVPIARIVGLATTSRIDELTRRGVIAKPLSSNRPVATGRQRPTARRSAAEVVSEQRG